MKIRVVWFGRAAAGPYERQVARYRARVDRRWPAEDLPVRPVAGGRDRDPARALAAEATAAQRRMPAGWLVAALSEDGRMTTSLEFARFVGDLQSRGADGVVFLVGSDLGLDASLLARADFRLSLGPMTLPHQLARLVLWEQLFRASDILGGGGYHRSG